MPTPQELAAYEALRDAVKQCEACGTNSMESIITELFVCMVDAKTDSSHVTIDYGRCTITLDYELPEVTERGYH